ncbi:MAG: hypothetical protein CHACPFDD_00064 [Phycisphaerae bacterium]|nr:hypothetical protein [Phycisphaerae bacterium]
MKRDFAVRTVCRSTAFAACCLPVLAMTQVQTSPAELDGAGERVETKVVMGTGPDGKPQPFVISRALPPANGRSWHRAQDLATEADLVFRGVVTNIEYKLCEPDPVDSSQTPYTFVTYAVSDVLMGAVDGEQITLRFIGGLNPNTLKYMVRSHTPQFDVGDEDILFVQGNGVELCPLVREADGRLRIIDGQVYTDSGNAVFLGDAGELRVGAKYRLPEIESTEVAGRVMFFGARSHRAVDGPSDAALGDDVAAALTREIGILFPAGPFENVDAAIPFVETEF